MNTTIFSGGTASTNDIIFQLPEPPKLFCDTVSVRGVPVTNPDTGWFCVVEGERSPAGAIISCVHVYNTAHSAAQVKLNLPWITIGSGTDAT